MYEQELNVLFFVNVYEIFKCVLNETYKTKNVLLWTDYDY